MSDRRGPRHVVITGASRGIGAALASAYAGPDCRLTLIARRPAPLAEVAQACRATGAVVSTMNGDVRDAAGLAAIIADSDAATPIDLLIANAGISAGSQGITDPAEATRAVFGTNLDGVVNAVLPVIGPMRRRRHGQIAIMSSLAGHAGMPTAPAYAASKAAVRVYAEGLRGALARDGVGVTAICPGFVVSDITAANDFPMPFLMPAEHAAQLIRRRLARNPARIDFPWQLSILASAVGCLPPAAAGWLIRRLMDT